uniref:Uncharacterized protein n=1 Tax=Arundo donax TaxID=35708 RepID=A0A0A8Z0X5_ARUDO
MLDVDFITIIINLSVLKLGPIVIPDLHDVDFKFILSPLYKLLKIPEILPLSLRKKVQIYLVKKVHMKKL